MNETLQSRFSAEYLAHSFPEIPILQEFLNKLIYDRARKQAGNFNVKSKLGNSHTDSRLKNRKKELEAYTPVLKEQIKASRADASNLDDLKHELYMKERELEHINKVLEKSTVMEDSKMWLVFKENEAAVQLIDQLALHIIDWFIKGPLGPGTVEYNGVHFTAK